YARALADTLFERKVDAQKAAAQLRSMIAVLESSRPLREVWDNPAVELEQKIAVLDALAGKMALEPLVRNFMAVVIQHRRVPQLEEITQQFEAEVNERLGIANAQVTSARDLEPAERSQVESQIAAVTGKTVKASYNTDSAVLGGAVIRVGSTIYDGSVRGQLDRLKQQLVSNGIG
ncbi:MAG TPA: ATP synthase F1 subunit delta, partial [Terriglobales bacterium]|nr:ATP synthase F1 subunit delta [Terriglobales bacterium]